MQMLGERYSRDIALFGEAGHARMRTITAVVVGLGGLGAWVVHTLALQGVRKIYVIDYDRLEETDRNRSPIARTTDPIGTPKVDLASRLIEGINAAVALKRIPSSVLSPEALAAIIACDIVFGCVDLDGVRAALVEMTLAYDKPLIDLATDVPEPGVYGGRVHFAIPGESCLWCMDLLDGTDVRRFFMTPEAREAEDAIYGVQKSLLGRGGPAVAGLNMAIAGLASVEFMAWATGMRAPHRLLTYRGDRGTVTRSANAPKTACYYCRNIRGLGPEARVDRFIR